jgi:hypothetical protein
VTDPIIVVPVVEGFGEVESVPILVRRLAVHLEPELPLRVERPIRVPKSKLVRAGELERAVELAAFRITGVGSVLVLIDADDDCPATLGPSLVQRASNARPDVDVSVVVAKAEFEAWFLASTVSLRGRRGLSGEMTSPSDPEAIRGAKEWLRQHLPSGKRYSETLDQPALTSQFDLEQARSADSFDKCYREIRRILR